MRKTCKNCGNKLPKGKIDFCTLTCQAFYSGPKKKKATPGTGKQMMTKLKKALYSKKEIENSEYQKVMDFVKEKSSKGKCFFKDLDDIKDLSENKAKLLCRELIKHGHIDRKDNVPLGYAYLEILDEDLTEFFNPHGGRKKTLEEVLRGPIAE